MRYQHDPLQAAKTSEHGASNRMELGKSELGWESKVSLDDGLRETIAYFRHAVGG